MVTTVQTVGGPVQSDQLGVTLVHEHLVGDFTRYWNQPSAHERRRQVIAHAPVSIDYLGVLRNDPFLSLDNMRLDNTQTAVDELAFFREAGGQTIVDPTCRGIGRDPDALIEIAQKSQIHVIMGSGYYIEQFHPAGLRRKSIADVEEELIMEVREGISGVHAGLIGEIGISRDFTAEEEKVLRAAARAQRRTGVPLMVHLPGWLRYGPRVLDVIAEEGGKLDAVVLCHMNPSLNDPGYQEGLAGRGAWLEYDMLGMDFFYAEHDEQCPSDTENATAIVALFRAGFGDRLLLSSDVFVKIMLVRYGGFGYGHVLESFLPRLQRHGLTETDLEQMIVKNPRKLFEHAAGVVLSS